MSSKVIAVLGATGIQGGSVVDTFLAEPGWVVRGLTRNTSSDAAKSLAGRGVDVVQADLNNAASLEAALQDIHALFVVTDFWASYRPAGKENGQATADERLDAAGAEEEQQLRNAIDIAAKTPTLERLVISGLSDASKWSKGKYTRVRHYDSKARATSYAEERYPELWKKTSIFQAGYYLSNFTTNRMLKPVLSSEGVAQFISTLAADAGIPYIAAEEATGALVKALVLEAPGKNLIAYNEWLTPREMAAAFFEATGIKAEAVQLLPEESQVPPSEGVQRQMDETWAYYKEFGYEGRDDSTVIHPHQTAWLTRELRLQLDHPPTLQTVKQWFSKQEWTDVLGP